VLFLYYLYGNFSIYFELGSLIFVFKFFNFFVVLLCDLKKIYLASI